MSQTRFETIALAELEARNLLPDTSSTSPVALVVDDEALIADTLAAILNNAGYAAAAAYSGESALGMALLVPPELVITDVMMPGMNGIELAVALKEAVPDCRILLFSGHGSTSDLLEQAHLMGHDFALLSKPVHPADLLAKASHLVPQRQPTGRVPQGRGL
jgi:DNA-binding response OmpR family regulator